MGKLLSRVKNIIFSPKSEWQTIKAEQATVKDIIFKYVAILSVIPPIASIIGMSIVGFSFIHTTMLGPLVASFLWGLFFYISGIAAVIVSAAIINALTPIFNSMKDYPNALKVVAYSYTPMWIVGVLNVFPAPYWLMLILSLYSIYLLYLGLSRLMGTSQNKALGYAVASIIVIIAVEIVISYLVVRYIPMPA